MTMGNKLTLSNMLWFLFRPTTLHLHAQRQRNKIQGGPKMHFEINVSVQTIQYKIKRIPPKCD